MSKATHLASLSAGAHVHTHAQPPAPTIAPTAPPLEPISSALQREKAAGLTYPGNGARTLSEARHHVCYSAAAELDAIALMLAGAMEDTDEYKESEVLNAKFPVRCIAARVKQLANALMAGLNDEAVPVNGWDGLNRTVFVREGAQAAPEPQ